MLISSVIVILLTGCSEEEVEEPEVIREGPPPLENPQYVDLGTFIVNMPIIKNDIKLRINSLFPNKPLWEDTAPVRKILFSEFYRQ